MDRDSPHLAERKMDTPGEERDTDIRRGNSSVVSQGTAFKVVLGVGQKRTIIPARSVCLIQGVPEVPGQFRYAVMGVSSHVSQKGVLVAATLVDLEMEAIPVRVLNLNNETKILDKGAVIVTCEPVADIVARPQEYSGAQHNRQPWRILKYLMKNN
ncbi:hypothetical protein AVEN_45790-1 [Araneus ventricosus]|uniref:dUTPase-like domain-containing protein n=1 Tax=Araneus ventricosus TaxID=182803 RepID=A0A4Y2FEK9_ARAVE|nr:hypothetical protein AVEN_45790-1 [Araneus ventricosus]